MRDHIHLELGLYGSADRSFADTSAYKLLAVATVRLLLEDDFVSVAGHVDVFRVELDERSDVVQDGYCFMA